MPPDVRAAQERFRRVVVGLDRGCVAAHAGVGACDGPVQAHHAVYRQVLEKAGRDDLAWSPENGCALCYRHHRRHHNRAEPVPAACLPARCTRFAADHGFTDLLARLYTSPS